MQDFTNFKKNVLDLNHNYDLSVIDLAKEIGMSKQFFYKICSGDCKMPVRKITKLVNVLKSNGNISNSEILNILASIFKHNKYIPLSLVPDKNIDELIKISLTHSGIFDKISNLNVDLNNREGSSLPESDLP